MKNLKFYLIFAISVIVAACSTEDKLVDTVEATVTRGAVLRTIANDPSTFVFDDPTSVWSITWEAQDIEDGALFDDIEVYVDFVDNTPEDGTVETAEAFLTSIDISEFEGDVWGLPRVDYSIDYQSVLDALGIPFSTTYASDQINFRVVINLIDGRSITNTDLSGTVSGGSFFSSPLNYRANVVCPPKAGTIGTWQVDMQDSFGDGWNNATLDIIIDGETTSLEVSVAQGTANTEFFDITADDEVLSIQYRSGDFDGENTFQVYNPNNDLIIDGGPSPPADTELLDYCSDF